MHISDRDSFLKAAASGKTYIPLTKSWPADLETPLTTWLKVGEGDNNRPGVLLESVEGGERLGRWSIVASDPLWVARASGDRITRTWRDGSCQELNSNPIDALKAWLLPYKAEPISDLPCLGQLFGMWSYELINWIEPKVPVHKRDLTNLPDGIWMFMDRVLIFDQVKRLITAVVYADLTSNQSPVDMFEDASLRIQDLEQLMQSSLPEVKPLPWEKASKYFDKNIKSNWTKKNFESAVASAKDYIAKGDIFQIVLSQKFNKQVSNTPFQIYRSLRMVNPSPFMAFFNFGDWQLIGSSPEVMVQAKPSEKGILASLRPIAGTRPRGANSKEDHLLEQELLNDPKERSEHVMLVDLGRNDLGRVCVPGTVAVKELMVIERYSHVMHIVSQVQGILTEGMDIWDLLKASFPAGTVSGAPKIRAMQLIHQLENQGRGPYSGVYGSVDLNGAINTAITIRSIIVTREADKIWNVQIQAGAGVVADSIPEMEYQETINKAKGMFAALACLVDSN